MFDFIKQKDKQGHIECSLLLFLILFVVFSQIISVPVNIMVSSILALFVGASKELVHDEYLNLGTRDVMDMVANGIGVLGGIFLVLTSLGLDWIAEYVYLNLGAMLWKVG